MKNRIRAEWNPAKTNLSRAPPALYYILFQLHMQIFLYEIYQKRKTALF